MARLGYSELPVFSQIDCDLINLDERPIIDTARRTATFVDGLQRVAQVKVDAIANGQSVSRVTGATYYSHQGLAQTQYDDQIFTDNYFEWFSMVQPLPPVVQSQIFDYQGRPIQSSVLSNNGNSNVTQTTYDWDHVSGHNGAYYHDWVTSFSQGTSAGVEIINVNKRDYHDNWGRVYKTVNSDDLNIYYNTTFNYNPLSELLSVTNPLNEVTDYQYDFLGRMVQETHPDRGVTEMTYDLAGNVLTINNEATANQAQPITMDYHYSRLISKTYPETGILYDTRYYYGELGDGRNGAGRIIAIHQGEDFKIDSLVYDELGHVVSEKVRLNLPDGQRDYHTQYFYDSWGRILSMIYPDLELVSYFYNPIGLLSKVTGNIHGTALVNTLLDDLEYDGFDNISFLKYGNQTTSYFDYSVHNRALEGVRVKARLSADPLNNAEDYILDKTYFYDDMSRVNRVENTLPSGVAATTGMGGDYVNEYKYDAFNRLKAAKGTFTTSEPSTKTYEVLMQYNAAGGIVSKHQEVTGGFANAFHYDNQYEYSTTNPHQLTKLGNSAAGSGQPYEMAFAWNKSGSMRAVSVRPTSQDAHDTIERYVYNEEQWMMGHVNKQTSNYTHFVYDHTGQRILKGSVNAASFSTNGQGGPLSMSMDPYTLYVNPFYVAVQHNSIDQVSKHYYFNGQRFATKMGFYLPPGEPPSLQARQAGDPMSMSMNSPLFKNLQTTMDALGYNDTLSWAVQTTSGPDTNLAHYPRLMYYYHPDYLGHVEYITDLDGVPLALSGAEVYQYFYYTAPMSRLPTSKPLAQRCFSADWSRPLARWGETLIEEKATRPGMHFESPYRFNAKELDEETGLYYYGARYYNPMVSVWLGVDPLAEKYPSLSSYVFTGNNPIMLVDPDGREIVAPEGSAEREAYNKFKSEVLVRFESAKTDEARETYKTILDELVQLEQSKTKYHLVGDGGEFTYNTEKEQIEVKFSLVDNNTVTSMESLAH
jgi:RHS repeat-associated protein